MHQEMYVKALTFYLLTLITAAYNLSEMKPRSGEGMGSSLFLPLSGNVYPTGHYTVSISIGNNPQPYVLDLNTGRDLTWIQCFGNPPKPYVLQDKNIIYCSDPACAILGPLRRNADKCLSPDAVCDYEVNYVGGSSYKGMLVRDFFPLKLRDGTTVTPIIAFGCGDDEGIHPSNHPFSDGYLGLGNGEVSILKQLSSMSVIRNVVGHCLSGEGGGYLFLGDIPAFGVAWRKLLDPERYNLGKADILFGGEATDIRGLEISFDSGSTFTYIESKAYGALLDQVIRNMNGRLSYADTKRETTLPVCWQGPFQTIAEVAGYFMTVTLNFRDENNNVQFQMPPESYLIITDQRNVCLGILNSVLEPGVGDMNLIGDISMQDKLVIYDNERGLVGWAAVDTCNREF